MSTVLQGKEWLSLAEAAEYSKLSVSRVRQFLLAGRIVGMKLNKRAWAVSLASLKAFLDEDRPPGNPNFQKPD